MIKAIDYDQNFGVEGFRKTCVCGRQGEEGRRFFDKGVAGPFGRLDLWSSWAGPLICVYMYIYICILVPG